MPDLFLDWGDIGPYGTFLPDTDPSAVSATVDTGGVAVDITFDAIAPETRGFTFNAPGYVAPGETFDRQSFFKIISEGGSGTAGSPSPTATTALDFRSTDPLYTDSVQNVGFRLNEVDFSATGGDLSSAGDGWQDIVTVNAFDADGNPVPVTLTPATVAAVSGDTATGTTDGVFESASGSILVEIPGPVSRIEISYANGDTAQQAVLISDVEFSTVDVADDLPVAEDDTATTPEDTAVVIDVLSNDSDPDGQPLTVTSATATNGTVTINPDGTLTYTPDTDYNGPDTILYTIEDPDGNEDTAEVAVTVTPDGVNSDPVAVDDTVDTDIDTSVTLDPTDNDSDPDGDPITLTDIGTPTNGTATLNPDGTVTYTPDTGFVGEDTIPYTIEDGEGGTDTGEIIVTVDDPANTPPVAVNDTTSTPLDTPITVTPLANDSDPDGDPLTVGSIGTPSSGTAVLNPDGTVTYTPEPGFEGTVTIPYTAIDPDDATGTAEIIVTVGDPDNTPPVAVDDEAETDLDTAITIDPTLNDTDADGDPITVTGIGTASNGTATLNPDGTVTYTPDTGFVGEDTVSYTIEDGEGGTDTGEIIFSVPCFTPGTLIATPQGERLVEELQVGDRVMTRDNGIQEIRWIGRRDLTGHELARAPEMRPVLIRRGALGPDLPAHDMLVSPQHRVLVSNARTALYFDEREVLVAAKHLIGLEGVDEVDATGVSYIHIMFDQHEVVLSNGAWSESFQPGDYTLGGLGAEQREEIYALFPELALPEGRRAYVAARRSLKRHEAAILTA